MEAALSLHVPSVCLENSIRERRRSFLMSDVRSEMVIQVLTSLLVSCSDYTPAINNHYCPKTQNGGDPPPLNLSGYNLYRATARSAQSVKRALNGTPLTSWNLSPLNKHRHVRPRVVTRGSGKSSTYYWELPPPVFESDAIRSN